MNKRLQRLIENGYSAIHLFGDWYFVRVYSKNYAKISPWWFHKVKGD